MAEPGQGSFENADNLTSQCLSGPGGNSSPEGIVPAGDTGTSIWGLRTAGSYCTCTQNYLAQMAVILRLKNAVSN